MVNQNKAASYLIRPQGNNQNVLVLEDPDDTSNHLPFVQYHKVKVNGKWRQPQRTTFLILKQMENISCEGIGVPIQINFRGIREV